MEIVAQLARPRNLGLANGVAERQSAPRTALKGRVLLGGEKFDPSERGRGANWAQWRKR
jgi:hypothetical protein